MMERKNRGVKKRTSVSGSLIIALLVLFSGLPLVYVVSTSLSTSRGLSAGRILPEAITLDQYRSLIINTDFLLWMKNSMIISGTTALLAVFVTSLSAYALSRFPFPGRRNITSGLLIVQLFPNILALVAVYKILQILRLLDTHAGLVLVYLAGAVPFSAWLIKGYFDSIPATCEEAAAVDGAGPFRTFFYITLPMSMPIIVVVFAFNFIAAYSDFLLAAVVLTEPKRYTLALGLRSFLEGDFSTNWPQFCAGALLGALPILLLFLAGSAVFQYSGGLGQKEHRATSGVKETIGSGRQGRLPL
ncbi:MAG: ABC transporter permease subunit [Deltaproteobacteria bacterium]|nr:ABC transporter permease subunit [Candidatus Zymogenaceae bacterium]